MRVAPKVELTPEQTSGLERWANGRKTTVRLAERAKIVLSAARGQQDLEIAPELSITPKNVSRWRYRFLRLGLPGLQKDAPRPGRTPSIEKKTVAQIVRRTTREFRKSSGDVYRAGCDGSDETLTGESYLRNPSAASLTLTDSNRMVTIPVSVDSATQQVVVDLEGSAK